MTMIDKCIELLKRDDIKYNVKEFLKPIVVIIIQEIYLYIYIFLIFIIIIFLLILGIFYLLLRNNNSTKY